MASATSRKVEQSRRLQQRAESMIPGGVNSPVRAFRAVGGDPDSGPRRGRRTRRDRGRGLQRHELRRFHAVGGRPCGVGDLRISARAEGSLRQLRDGSDHVGDPAGAGGHGAQDDRQV